MDKKRDYLDVDDSINGQEYVCLSFISPNDVIKDKEGFKVAKFLQSYAKDIDKDFDDFYDEYQNFQYKYQDDIQRDFDKEVNGLTNIRGVKVRGVYSTKDEAEYRAKKLHQKDQNHHVFIGQVGYWLPWNPCADKIQDEKFLNEGLNDLMEKYKENRDDRDVLYEEEKREKIKAAEKEVKEHKEKINKESEENKLKEWTDNNIDYVNKHVENSNKIEEIVEEASTNNVEESSSNVEESSSNVEESISNVEESSSNVEESSSNVEDKVLFNNTVNDYIKNTLNEVDPWMKNKQEN